MALLVVLEYTKLELELDAGHRSSPENLKNPFDVSSLGDEKLCLRLRAWGAYRFNKKSKSMSWSHEYSIFNVSKGLDAFGSVLQVIILMRHTSKTYNSKLRYIVITHRISLWRLEPEEDPDVKMISRRSRLPQEINILSCTLVFPEKNIATTKMARAST